MEVAAQYDLGGAGCHFLRPPVDYDGSQIGGIAVADENAAAVAAPDETAVLPASIESSAPVAD
jgi:hypothetical protein